MTQSVAQMPRATVPASERARSGEASADEQTSVAFIADRRHVADPAMNGAHAALIDAGCRVELLVPDADRLFEIPASAPPWHVVLSRGRDLAGFGLLVAAAARGVLAINTPRSIELVRNKIGMHAVLLDHGIPMPRTWFAADPGTFRRLPVSRFPLVVKPFDGDGARGIFLLTKPGDVDLVGPRRRPRELWLAQERLQTDGWDLKLYGIGSRVWAVRKPSPVSLEEPGPAGMRRVDGAAVVELDSELQDIALTCGRACGLQLWGVDVASTPNGPVVIEVNDFPSYSAIPEAGDAIAQLITSLAAIDRVRQRSGLGHLDRLLREPR